VDGLSPSQTHVSIKQASYVVGAHLRIVLYHGRTVDDVDFDGEGTPKGQLDLWSGAVHSLAAAAGFVDLLNGSW
jgi:hypothetical protein